MPVVNVHELRAGIVTSPQVNLDTLKIWHVTSGLYLWEFITTLDYEWKVIRGRLPYRWTIWVYSLARLAALVGMILCLVIVNVTTPINCELVNLLAAFFFCLSATAASLLIILRTIAIWNQNKVVMALAGSILVSNIAFHLQSIIRLRRDFVWDPVHFACESVKKNDPSMLSFLPAMISDMVLLLIVLTGLVVMRRGGGGTIGLTKLVWKQGVIWLVVGSVAEIPPLVLAFLHLNDPLHSMFETPGVIIMTVAATRMHRCLVNFASSDIMDDSHKMSSSHRFAAPKAKWTDTLFGWTIPKREHRVEVGVQETFEQHPTGSTSNSDSCTIISTRSTGPPIIVSPFPSIPEAKSV